MIENEVKHMIVADSQSQYLVWALLILQHLAVVAILN